MSNVVCIRNGTTYAFASSSLRTLLETREIWRPAPTRGRVLYSIVLFWDYEYELF